MSAIVYRTLDKRNWVYQPNFTRFRHRWRGPRESLKINTEINQVRYDLRRLEDRSNVVSEQLEEMLELMYNGSTLEDVELDGGDAVLYGIDDLASRVEQLKWRIKRLEDV